MLYNITIPISMTIYICYNRAVHQFQLFRFVDHIDHNLEIFGDVYFYSNV